MSHNLFTTNLLYWKIKAMGKCKKRTLHKSNSSYFMTREMAVNNILNMVKNTSHKDFDLKEAVDTISLFGISAEELSEAGVPYEYLKAFGSTIN